MTRIMTKEMKQWQAAMKKIVQALFEAQEKFPTARLLLIAGCKDVDTFEIIGNGCPHDTDDLLGFAMEKNDEALVAHEAMGEHGRN